METRTDAQLPLAGDTGAGRVEAGGRTMTSAESNPSSTPLAITDAEQWKTMMSRLPELEQIKLQGWLVAVVTADLLDDLFERLDGKRRGLAEETMEMSLR